MSQLGALRLCIDVSARRVAPLLTGRTIEFLAVEGVPLLISSSTLRFICGGLVVCFFSLLVLGFVWVVVVVWLECCV